MGRYKRILQWVLAVCCLGYLVRFFVKNTEELKVLGNVRPSTIAAMGLFFLIGQLLTSFRFQVVLEKSSGKKLPYWKWFKIFILGRFLNLLFPQFGNLYRGVTLKKTYSITYTKYIASFFSFSWMYFCLNLILALSVVLITEPSFLIGRYKATHFLCILIATALGGPVLLHLVLPARKSSVRYIAWVQEKSSEVLRVSVQNMADAPYMAKFISLSIIIYFNNLVLFYLAFSTFGASVSLSPLVLFLVLFALSNRIILTPGNLGIREIAFGKVSSQMNIGMAEGILVSAVIRLIATIIIASLGIIFGGLDILRSRNSESNP